MDGSFNSSSASRATAAGHAAELLAHRGQRLVQVGLLARRRPGAQAERRERDLEARPG